MKRALLIVSLVLPAAGCASAQATAPAAPAGLEVPPVPPRVLAPLPNLEAPDIEPVQPLPETAVPEPPRRPASRPSTPAPVAPKPDPAQEVVPPEAQPASPPPAAPPLRPADSGAGPQAEEEVRLIIKRAEDMLQSIDYGNLTRDRQVNYDQAKNLLKQADESLKEKNVALARSFAKRAEDYAKVVGSR